MNAEKFKIDILPYQNKMYRYALSIVYDMELAKDIVQEVLLKIWDKREGLSEVNNKEAWCIRLTRNLCLDKLKLKSRQNVGLEEVSHKYALMASPETMTEDNDLMEAIQKAMLDLSEQQQEIFRLRDLLGYSNKEIKSLTGLSDGQIKVNLFRARQKIKLKVGKLINYGL